MYECTCNQCENKRLKAELDEVENLKLMWEVEPLNIKFTELAFWDQIQLASLLYPYGESIIYPRSPIYYRMEEKYMGMERERCIKDFLVEHILAVDIDNSNRKLAFDKNSDLKDLRQAAVKVNFELTEDDLDNIIHGYIQGTDEDIIESWITINLSELIYVLQNEIEEYQYDFVLGEKTIVCLRRAAENLPPYIGRKVIVNALRDVAAAIQKKKISKEKVAMSVISTIHKRIDYAIKNKADYNRYIRVKPDYKHITHEYFFEKVLKTDVEDDLEPNLLNLKKVLIWKAPNRV